MRELTVQEIRSVDGASGPVGAFVGAVGGATGYYGTSISSGEGTWGGLASATFMGAIGGFFLGPAANIGAAATATGLISFYGGLIVGGVSSWIDSFEY